MPGESDIGRDYLVWDYAQFAVQRAVRSRNHLMIRTYDDFGYPFDPVELYVVGEDLYMTRNLAERSPEIVGHCDHLMKEWIQEQMAKPFAIADPLQSVLQDRKADAQKRLSGE
jgi:hypothetical protein